MEPPIVFHHSESNEQYRSKLEIQLAIQSLTLASILLDNAIVISEQVLMDKEAEAIEMVSGA
jgi:uncharacterized coiled-coil protein SlyX